MEDNVRGVLRNITTILFIVFVMLAFLAKAQAAKNIDKIIVGSDSQKGIIVKGKVTDEQGLGIPGVTIIVKGTSQGATTNLDGEYEIEVNNPDAVLLFSFIGMEQQEIPVKGKTQINVELKSESQELEAVVVTGYQSIDRRMFTGSAEVVSAKDAQIDGATDISKVLQGKAAGVQITDVSGTFGAAPKLRVRGASSIYGNSNPLWVVDGVILDQMVNLSASDLSSGDATTLIGSAVAGLNAEDIESFQILKDASATALYGAKAMNGVIVITTKKGKNGAASMNYTGEFTVRATPSYNRYAILNSQDQMSVLLEMEKKGLLKEADLFLAKNGGVFSKYYQMTDMYENGEYRAINRLPNKLYYLQKAELRNTNWFQELFSPSLQQNHSLSISSGTEKSSNYVSLSYYNDPGWAKSTDVTRYTFNTNTTYHLSNELNISIIGNASVRNQKAPGTLNQELDVVEGEYTRDFDINPFSYALNTSRTMDSDEFYRQNYTNFNINHELNNNYIQLGLMDAKIQMNLSYKPVKELELNVVGSYRYAKSTREHRILNGSNMAEAYRAAKSTSIIQNNNFLWGDPDKPDALPIVVLGEGGFYNTQDNKLTSYYARGSANYNRIENGIHAFNLLVGAEISSTDRLSRFNNGYGYLWGKEIAVTDYRILRKVIDAGDSYFGMSETFERQVGVFGTGTYSFNGTYTLNATLRTEGSNQMGTSNTARWLPTWNISGSWNIKNEPFLKDVDFLTDLALRATYGLTATMSPNVNASAVYNAATTYRPFQNDRETMLYISSLANEELTWEKMKETNIGLDLRIYQRINLTMDVYSRNAFDLIGIARTSGIGGEPIKFANVADMKASGAEFALGIKTIKGFNGFSMTNNLTFAYNQNKITNLKSIPRVIDLVGITGAPKEGYSQSGLFSIPFAGLDESGLPTFYDENGDKAYNINFQNTENTKFLKYEGQLDPKITGGLDNALKYKNLSLNLFFTYQAGNVLRLYPTYSSSYSDMRSMPEEMKNRWMKPGEEKYTDIPAIPSTDQLSQNPDLVYAYNAYNFSTARVAKGDFVRLKTVTFSYNFSNKFAERLKVNSLQLKGTVSNVCLIYTDKRLHGQDPEFISSGGVAMPTPRKFTLSLRAGF